jgi:hypothetical protein
LPWNGIPVQGRCGDEKVRDDELRKSGGGIADRLPGHGVRGQAGRPDSLQRSACGARRADAGAAREKLKDPPVYAGDIVIIDGSGVKARQKQILNSLPVLSIFRPF